MALLPQIAGFAVTLLILLALNRWITRQVQIIGYRLTGHEQVAVVVYFLLLLPGIVLHELSHALVALVLGLKVGKFSLGPRNKGRYIQLGSVQITSGGLLRDSLVGLAPFLSGTVILLLVSYRVFNVGALGAAWLAGGWHAIFAAVPGFWRVPDFWLWAYLIFTVSNAMTPSPADREPWRATAVFLVLALLVAWLAGLLAPAAQALAPEVAGAMPVLTLSFIFTLALDLAAAALLWLVEALILGAQHTVGR